MHFRTVSPGQHRHAKSSMVFQVPFCLRLRIPSGPIIRDRLGRTNARGYSRPLFRFPPIPVPPCGRKLDGISPG